MQLTFTPLAAQDLESIGDYIAADNPLHALTFIKKLQEQCLRITNNPLGYRLRTELGNDLRSCCFGDYVIFFSTDKHCVTIIRILHGARDISIIVARPAD
jgi:toxin ParE1/3/4